MSDFSGLELCVVHQIDAWLLVRGEDALNSKFLIRKCYDADFKMPDMTPILGNAIKNQLKIK